MSESALLALLDWAAYERSGNTSSDQVLFSLLTLFFGLWGIAASVFSFPSIAQTMAPQTQKWLARGIKVGFVIILTIFVLVMVDVRVLLD